MKNQIILLFVSSLFLVARAGAQTTNVASTNAPSTNAAPVVVVTDLTPAAPTVVVHRFVLPAAMAATVQTKLVTLDAKAPAGKSVKSILIQVGPVPKGGTTPTLTATTIYQ